ALGKVRRRFHRKPGALMRHAQKLRGSTMSTTTSRVDTASAKRRRGFTPYALLVPSLVVLAAVIGWPLIQLFVMSFQEYGRAQVFGAAAPFIGLDNYISVLTDQQFWNVLGRSILFCLVCVVLTMVGGTLIALLMMRLGKGFRVLVSVGLLLAWAMPALTATIVWGWMFDTSYGVVNFVSSEERRVGAWE